MSDPADVLRWLQRWYVAQCDGEWEHRWGVEVGTLDNPGWTVRIDVRGTALEHRGYSRQSVKRGGDDWAEAWRSQDAFEAACGPRNLGEVLMMFRCWAEAAGTHG